MTSTSPPRLLSVLHRKIRLSNWASIPQTLAQYREEVEGDADDLSESSSEESSEYSFTSESFFTGSDPDESWYGYGDVNDDGQEENEDGDGSSSLSNRHHHHHHHHHQRQIDDGAACARSVGRHSLRSSSTPASPPPLPLLLQRNAIGWTAVHFASLHGAPDLIHWKWILMTIIEEYGSYIESVNRINNAQEARDWSRTRKSSHHHQHHQRLGIDDGLQQLVLPENPFFQRTEAGHAATDLFFSKRLHPFPWERTEVRRDAERLSKSINTILELVNSSNNSLSTEHELVIELKRRIRSRIEDERFRQRRNGSRSDGIVIEWEDNAQSTSHVNNDGNRELVGAIIDRHVVPLGDIGGEVEEGREELEHEMSLHDHVHETEETHVVAGAEVNDIQPPSPSYDALMSEESLNALVDFWHEMELIVMAATQLSLSIDEIDELDENDDEENGNEPYSSSNHTHTSSKKHWFLLHGLAKTGCPDEISQLALALYPRQVRRRDHLGDLPLHIAASSHKASALADGTWQFNEQRSNENGNNLSSTPPMIKCLLEAYPEAGMELNAAGRYPINMAIIAGKTWLDGVGDIFAACPNVVLVGSLDEPTNLPSFLLASLACKVEFISSSDDNEMTYPVRNSLGQIVSFQEEMRAKRNESSSIGSMWRYLPPESKARALKTAKSDIELIRTTTVFELLRAYPSILVNIGIAM